MKKKMLAALFSALLVFAGVACSSEAEPGVEGGAETEPAVEATT